MSMVYSTTISPAVTFTSFENLLQGEYVFFNSNYIFYVGEIILCMLLLILTTPKLQYFGILFLYNTTIFLHTKETVVMCIECSCHMNLRKAT